MLKMDSHAFILTEINLHSKVWSAELGLQKGVPGIIERSLQKHVAERKFINKCGSSLSCSFSPRHKSSKEVHVDTQKNIIAQKSIAFIKGGMFALTFIGVDFAKMAGALRPDFIYNLKMVKLQSRADKNKNAGKVVKESFKIFWLINQEKNPYGSLQSCSYDGMNNSIVK